MQPKINFVILPNDESFLDHSNSEKEEKNSRECRERQKLIFSGKSELSKLQKRLLTHTLSEDA